MLAVFNIKKINSDSLYAFNNNTSETETPVLGFVYLKIYLSVVLWTMTCLLVIAVIL